VVTAEASESRSKVEGSGSKLTGNRWKQIKKAIRDFVIILDEVKLGLPTRHE
jgi:hypothetical protein